MTTSVRSTPEPMICITKPEQLARFKNGALVVYKSDNPDLRCFKQHSEKGLFFAYVKGFVNNLGQECFHLYRVWKGQMGRNIYFIDPVLLDTYTLTRYREPGFPIHDGTPVDSSATRDREYFVSVHMRAATVEETAAIVSAVAKKQLSFYPAYQPEKATDQKRENPAESETVKDADAPFDLARAQWNSTGVIYPA